MALFSSSISITRYKVSGTLTAPVNEKILDALQKNAITRVSDDDTNKKIGWTSLERPYQPDFESYSFTYADYFAFSLRVDKKTISPKLIKQQFTIESEKKMLATGRSFLSAGEKKEIRDEVTAQLTTAIPAVPEIYELVWQHEKQSLYFFTNLKSANEDLEHLFNHSFNLRLDHLFPYSYAHNVGLSPANLDLLDNIQPLNRASV